MIATLFYQFSLYVCVRLARRGFTLGELGVVCNAATALFMETVNLTRMKVSPWHPIFETTLACKLTDLSDSNTPYTVHQDISSSNPAIDIPTSSHSRISPRWLPPLSTALSITSSSPKARTSPPIPTRETSPPPLTGSRFLRRLGNRLRWSRRILDAVVP